MSLSKIVSAQIADYPRVHRAEPNLAIHLMAIPMFWAGLVGLLIAIFTLTLLPAIVGAALLASSVALQGWGHAQEKEKAIPFTGPLNFLIRLTTESLIVFPRFVLTGGWIKAWRNRAVSA